MNCRAMHFGRPGGPLRSRRWAWLGRRAHASIAVAVARLAVPVRATKSSRSAASLTMPRCSIPRSIPWGKVPGASSLACLGMGRTPV